MTYGVTMISIDIVNEVAETVFIEALEPFKSASKVNHLRKPVLVSSLS